MTIKSFTKYYYCVLYFDMLNFIIYNFIILIFFILNLLYFKYCVLYFDDFSKAQKLFKVYNTA